MIEHRKPASTIAAPTGPGAGSIALLCLALALSAANATAEPPAVPNAALSWSANTGWINWSPHPEHQAQLHDSFCSGFIYSANTGWISLGDGSPDDRTGYRNDSADDFGVNIDTEGNLRGMAYGANIGWIMFDPQGSPKLDRTTGLLSGFLYSANIGWINLANTYFPIRAGTLPPEIDQDRDGIPDDWELQHSGDLSLLSAGADQDRDGQTDYAEFVADTNPLDPADLLKIETFSFDPANGTSTLAWPVKPSRQYLVQRRHSLDPASPWLDSGLGPQAPQGPVLSITLTNSPDFKMTTFRVQAVAPQ